MIQTIAIVSLSSGTIGEDFVSHEVLLGLRRLERYGLRVKMMPHAKSGIRYVKNHPEDRAQDLLDACSDPSVDMILCAIGGDDTYRLLPYLFDHDELKHVLRPVVFLGFSDSTINHLMLHKLGLPTFYGQSFLADVCEMDRDMLPYSKHCFEELLRTGTISEIRPSDVYYEERTDWSPQALGTARTAHANSGFELLQGPSVFEGEILGGCIDSLYDLFDSTRYPDSVTLTSAYSLFPSTDDWRGKILLLETSEEQATPDRYREMLEALKKTGIFTVISGILLGKPISGIYENDYKRIIRDVVSDPDLPILANLNIGHATPRCIIPFGVRAVVDAGAQVIRFPAAPTGRTEVRTDRLILTPADNEEMEERIDSEPSEEMKTAYREMLDGAREHEAIRELYTAWFMRRKDDPSVILGDLCFKGISDDGVTEIGYGIKPEFEGRGYTTEAVRALVRWALSRPDVLSVEAEAEESNAPSLRVLEKAGFVRNGKIGEEGPRFTFRG